MKKKKKEIYAQELKKRWFKSRGTTDNASEVQMK